MDYTDDCDDCDLLMVGRVDIDVDGLMEVYSKVNVHDYALINVDWILYETLDSIRTMVLVRQMVPT